MPYVATILENTPLWEQFGDSSCKKHTLYGDSQNYYILSGDSLCKKHTICGDSILKTHTLSGDAFLKIYTL
jgi:hypothetical protein